ncbi:unnamed protein product [Prorocentrum cordatum]|uniref:Uncharacterized protein n=1 Tax=Prorocentrum cordatum TaxID=2364126 RepID=A0ABN9T1W6_9DINO|nr:unnamed protein product [Polarella glacialis]
MAKTEQSIHDRRTKLVELRAQHLELAKKSTLPPAGKEGDVAAAHVPIAAIGLYASKRQRRALLGRTCPRLMPEIILDAALVLLPDNGRNTREAAVK